MLASVIRSRTMLHSEARATLLLSVAVTFLACAEPITEPAVPEKPVVEAPPSEAAPIAPAPPAASAPPIAEQPVVQAPPSAPASSTPTSAPTAASAAPAARQRKPPPQNQRDCKACNGDWGTHGISSTPSCNCRTKDGGKRCKDGNECEGLCTAADDPEREVTDRGPPARGFFVGRCSKLASVFGCYRPIDDGASRTPVDLSEPPQMICAD
jgi:hypothetical protein